ncbi:vitelline membrane outer layer protein 1-like [Oratosquilla oratoria]|uniref:vitelline membrane outer layer protein 1-like n=1 Tax=Oratosquilla oratoria TaxID=337810 RepID=UPI003F766DF3
MGPCTCPCTCLCARSCAWLLREIIRCSALTVSLENVDLVGPVEQYLSACHIATMLVLWSLALLLASGASARDFDVVAEANQRKVVETLEVPDGLDRGVWGNVDLCKEGSYAYSFDMKYAAVGHLDDTAVNGLRLYCQGNLGFTGTVSSLVGKWGEWKSERPCRSGYYAGMRLEAMSYQGALGDDLGVTNVEMRCQDGTVHNGLYGLKQLREVDNTQEVPHELPEGIPPRVKEAIRLRLRSNSHWSFWTSCSWGLRICGVQSRVEPEHVLDDDAGLTDLIFFCCD